MISALWTRHSFEPADIVGITAFTAHVVRAYEIAQWYVKRGIPVIMGGIHVSMLPEEALQFCSSVLVGEAEETWPLILADFEKGCLRRRYDATPPDIASLPKPRIDLLETLPYRWSTLQTSRGCPMDCSFCSVTRFNGRRFRRKPMEKVIDELLEIKNKYIFIVDDNLLGYSDTKWLHDFFMELIRRKIRKYYFVQASIKFGEDPGLLRLAAGAGVRLIVIGMESINAQTLKRYNKTLNAEMLAKDRYVELIGNIRRAGLALVGAFILGGDEDGPEVFEETYKFVVRSGIDVLQITKPTPLPGTRFFDSLSRENRIIACNYPQDWRQYRFSRMVYTPRNMSIDEVYAGFHMLRKRFYSIPVKVQRYLRTLKDTRKFSSVIISYRMNRTYEKAFRNSELYPVMERCTAGCRGRRAFKSETGLTKTWDTIDS